MLNIYNKTQFRGSKVPKEPKSIQEDRSKIQ
jgi:hypothetical protein